MVYTVTQKRMRICFLSRLLSHDFSMPSSPLACVVTMVNGTITIQIKLNVKNVIDLKSGVVSNKPYTFSTAKLLLN